MYTQHLRPPLSLTTKSIYSWSIARESLAVKLLPLEWWCAALPTQKLKSHQDFLSLNIKALSFNRWERAGHKCVCRGNKTISGKATHE